MLYTPTSREVAVLRRPFVLLRFHPPEYEIRPGGGTVTWPIHRGLLVAKRGEGRGYLGLTVERKPGDGPQATVAVSSGGASAADRRIGLVRPHRPRALLVHPEAHP